MIHLKKQIILLNTECYNSKATALSFSEYIFEIVEHDKLSKTMWIILLVTWFFAMSFSYFFWFSTHEHLFALSEICSSFIPWKSVHASNLKIKSLLKQRNIIHKLMTRACDITKRNYMNICDHWMYFNFKCIFIQKRK